MNTATAQREPLTATQVEAARLFGVTDRTIRRWEKKGLIHGRRINGGAKHYPYAKLKALAEGGDGGIAAQD